MRAEIKKSALHGRVTAPTSKSYAHRLLICAALADGKSRIDGIMQSEDVLATADCLMALGASINFDGAAAVIEGIGGRVQGGARLCCRESGSTLRFLIPVSLLGGGGSFVCTPRLVSRGVGVYRDILCKRDVSFDVGDTVITACGQLKSGSYVIPGDISSQFVTGMLLALPLACGDSVIEVTKPFESRPYVDVTLDVLERFGANIRLCGDGIYKISGGTSYAPQNAEVEGDWSNAAFFFAANALGADIEVCGLNDDSRQGDRVCVDYLQKLKSPGAVLDMTDCPDLAPIMFTAAAALHGGSFTGTRRLRIKESDRAAAMAAELRKFGASIDVGEDSVEVHPSPLHAPTEPLCSCNDHRVVMSLAVLCTLTGGTIEGAEAVKKSFPDFFEVMRKLGTEVTLYE